MLLYAKRIVFRGLVAFWLAIIIKCAVVYRREILNLCRLMMYLLCRKKCSEHKLLHRMVECLKDTKSYLQPLLCDRNNNQKLICAQTENLTSCVNLALAQTECNTNKQALEQTTHFVVHALYEHRWACKNIKTNEKKCEERSLVPKLSQCVRLLRKTLEPIDRDKETKRNTCMASDTFLLCIAEAASETACRQDSQVMFHVSHFADKVMRHHKWTCDRNSAHGSTEKPKLESLQQKVQKKLEDVLSGTGSHGDVPSAVFVESGSSGDDGECNIAIARSAVDFCQQSAYDKIKQKRISQSKHLCTELKLFKDCSIEAARKHGCSTDKNAETYVYDRVKDSFYKYLTDCRPLWSSATSCGAINPWVLSLLAIIPWHH